jgi:DNA-binding NtrC family response regulator
VAATKRELKGEVERGKFREDLYFRLAVVPVTVPPLRSRREDIPPLVERFLDLARKRDPAASSITLSPATVQALTAHDWPGNVRELRTCSTAPSTSPRRAARNEARIVDLPVTGDGLAREPGELRSRPKLPRSTRQIRVRLRAPLRLLATRRHAGNISAAAREAKMDGKHLYDLARRHGLRKAG